MEILKNHKELHDSAINACRYLLKSHGKTITEKLLKSLNIEHRKIILKLLTAIVCFEPQLGRQLLTNFDIITNTTYKMLLWHSKNEIKNIINIQDTNTKDTETVRKCYIHFILSYLIDGNLMLTKNLLDKYELINSLLSGLIYDDHITVCVVLNTLKKFVLECTQISKTKKVHIFDVDNLKHLIKLYDWKGPKYFYEMHQNNKNEDKLKNFVNADECQIVAENVHEFLKILLTSRKYGVAFDAITNYKAKHNYIQLDCVKSFLQKPWLNDLKADLVIQILKTCPELAKNAIKKYSTYLNYFQNEKDWLKIAKFLQNLINELNPKILESGLDKISITDFSYWIKDICLPADGLNSIKHPIVLKSKDYYVRLNATKLLLIMFKQHCNYMNIIIKHEKYKGYNDLRKFKFEIFNHLFVNFPTIENIVLSLFDTIKQNDNENDKILLHLDYVLDLILLICKTYHSFIDKTSMIIDFLTLIQPLYETTSSSLAKSTKIETAELDKNQNQNTENLNLIHIEMKAIKTILLLQPKSLLPQQQSFSNVITSFINTYVYGSFDDKYQNEAGQLLKGIFMNTGLFENDNYSNYNTFEIDIWLEALRYIDNETLDKIKEILILNFQCASKNDVETQISNTTKNSTDNKLTNLSLSSIKNDHDDDNNDDYEMMGLNNEKTIQQLFENIENDVTIQEYIETPILGKLYSLIVKTAKATTGTLDSSIKNYLDIVSLLLFYYIPSSKIIKNLCQEYDTISKSLHKFMLHWIDIKKCGKLKLDKIPYLNLLYNSILDGEQNFYEIFQGTKDDTKNNFLIIIDNKEYYLNKILKNERLIVIYCLQIIFIISQQIQQQNFVDEKIQKSCIHFCLNFIKILWYYKKQKDANQEIVVDDTTTITTATTNNDKLSSLSYFEYILKYIYRSHFYLLQNFIIFPENQSQKNYLNFILELTDCINSLEFEQFQEYTMNFRKKCCNQIISSILKETNNNNNLKDQQISSEIIIKILDTLKLSSDNCCEILQNLSNLESKKFLNINQKTKSIYYDILILILNRIAELKESKIQNEIITKIAQIYIDLAILTSKTSLSEDIELNFDKYEESLYNILNIYHFYINSIPLTLFEQIFKNSKITKNTIRLAIILLERRDDFNDLFLKELKENLTKKELIYPLLNVYCQKTNLQIDDNLLQQIYHEYKSGISKSIDKPQKAGVIYKENLSISLYLIDNCMPLSECYDFTCKNFKFDTCEIYQIKLIEKIFIKSINAKITNNNDENNEIIHIIFVNYLYTIINLFLLIFKREQLDFLKIKYLSYTMYKWCEKYLNYSTGNYEKILNSTIWQQFCKNCLKYGMQTKNDLDINLDLNFNDDNNSHLLKILAYLCNIFYENDLLNNEIEKINDNNNENQQLQDEIISNRDVYQIFEMIISHSKFFDIVLSQNYSEIKTELMHLLLVLVHKNKQIIDKKHIPIYLGAYQAKLTVCDRYILALLQFYEKSGIDLYEYRPFIWGESAISYYSLKDKDKNENISLQQQEPSILYVMSLIDPYISKYTLKNFPIWRNLNTLKQLPECKFYDPNIIEFGINKVERIIENNLQQSNINKYDSSIMKLCLKRDDIYSECYDPAFIIPLMSMSFAPEVYSHPVRPVQNGLLALCFAALSSQDKNMRLAAGCIQLRYRQHFENHKFFDKPIWQQAYNNIQMGLNNLRLSWLKHKKRSSGTSIPRVPYISGIFLAKTINILNDPTNILYKTLTMYLRLKDHFNFLCIPEFNVLFHSPDIEHQQYRQFILEIIRDGIKCNSDLVLLITTNTFKAILGFYDSTISNLDTNLLILSIINNCVKIPSTIQIMINQIGIISWLNSIICNLEYYYFDTIEGIIAIINSLWYSLKINEKQFYNFEFIELIIFNLLCKLSTFMSGRIKQNSFMKFLNILSKTAKSNKYKTLSEENLNRIINCSQRYFQDYIWYLNNIQINGSNCIESKEIFLQKLKEDKNLDHMSILGLISLREFIIGWVRN